MKMARGTAVTRARQIPITISAKVTRAWGQITGALKRAVSAISDGGGRINTGMSIILTPISQMIIRLRVNPAARALALKRSNFIDHLSLILDHHALIIAFFVLGAFGIVGVGDGIYGI
jgi:hypothetical protein